MLLGLFGGMALAGIMAGVLGYHPEPGQLDRVMLIIGAISFHGVGLLWLNWLVRDHELTWPAVLGLRSRSLPVALVLGPGAGIVAFFVCQEVSRLVLELMSQARVAPEMQTTVRALQTSVSTLWVASFAVISIVIAPLVEECVFRGLIYPTVKQLGYPKIALWGTSLLFAASHANLLAFIPLTVLALMLTWIYERTDNLIAPVLTHATFNAINFALTILNGALLASGRSS